MRGTIMAVGSPCGVLPSLVEQPSVGRGAGQFVEQRRVEDASSGAKVEAETAPALASSPGPTLPSGPGGPGRSRQFLIGRFTLVSLIFHISGNPHGVHCLFAWTTWTSLVLGVVRRGGLKVAWTTYVVIPQSHAFIAART